MHKLVCYQVIGSRTNRYAVMPSGSVLSVRTIIGDDVKRFCEDDAMLHGEQLTGINYISDCPIFCDKALRVKFKLQYTADGTIVRRKLTVSRTPVPIVSETYHYSNAADVSVSFRFLTRRDSPWLPWWTSMMYPNANKIPSNVEDVRVVEVKRDKYGLTTINIKLLADAEGLDKSQYKFRAQELVQEELDKLCIELHTGHSLLQCTKGFSEVKK